MSRARPAQRDAFAFLRRLLLRVASAAAIPVGAVAALILLSAFTGRTIEVDRHGIVRLIAPAASASGSAQWPLPAASAAARPPGVADVGSRTWVGNCTRTDNVPVLVSAEGQVWEYLTAPTQGEPRWVAIGVMREDPARRYPALLHLDAAPHETFPVAAGGMILRRTSWGAAVPTGIVCHVSGLG